MSRLSRGWSVRFAADRAGVSHSTWRRIEPATGQCRQPARPGGDRDRARMSADRSRIFKIDGRLSW
uniref:helix-turn-helix domain-containing protein n=1 Tax=Virgisporangium ochraceum TaxID=65505 RepID=UPI001EF165F8|nr:helix-turn-helix transcriptional regulator [Virgisporangium ochraceum]